MDIYGRYIGERLMRVSANLKNGSLHMVKLFFSEKLASIYFIN